MRQQNDSQLSIQIFIRFISWKEGRNNFFDKYMIIIIIMLDNSMSSRLLVNIFLILDSVQK